MNFDFPAPPPPGNRNAAFTLVELITAVAITAFAFGGILVAYMQGTRYAEWTGRSLAAQALAIQQIEQARAATWFVGVTDQITNLSLLSPTTVGTTIRGYSVSPIDIPCTLTNITTATNYVTITQFTAGPSAVPLRMIRVDTVWPFNRGATRVFFTNTVATYISPD